MSQIPPNRALLYVLLLGLIPLFITGAAFLSQQNRLQEVETLFEIVMAQGAVKEHKQAQNQIVMKTFEDQDHFYIDKYLETLTFLEPEVEELEKLVQGSIPVSDQLLKRYEKLTGQENQLRFVEGQVQSTPTFQEVVESLTHPVEINTDDVHKILAKIEGVEINGYLPDPGRPQLIITDFKLEKKRTLGNNEAFLLNLKLLKREYL